MGSILATTSSQHVYELRRRKDHRARLCKFSCAVLHDRLSNGRMKAPPNILKFRLNGFPLDALDQKRMRRLRRTSDQMGVPIPDLIWEIVGQMIDAWIAEAELPHKIVKFPVAGRSRG